METTCCVKNNVSTQGIKVTWIGKHTVVPITKLATELLFQPREIRLEFQQVQQCN
jgi:hypothetical protein